MRNLGELIEEISDFSEEDVTLVFSRVAAKMQWEFDGVLGEEAELKAHVLYAIEDIHNLWDWSDISIVLSSIGIRKGLQFPRSPQLKPIEKKKLINPVIITTNGRFFHKANCKCLYWISNTGTRRVEQDMAYENGYTGCGYCRPDAD